MHFWLIANFIGIRCILHLCISIQIGTSLVHRNISMRAHVMYERCIFPSVAICWKSFNPVKNFGNNANTILFTEGRTYRKYLRRAWCLLCPSRYELLNFFGFGKFIFENLLIPSFEIHFYVRLCKRQKFEYWAERALQNFQISHWRENTNKQF